MPITDLGDATETLKKLVETGLTLYGATDAFFVSAASPDSTFTSTNTNTVSVHLFHVIESPEFKNLPPTFGTGPVPVRLAPMGLILQYVISVFTPGEDETSLNDGPLRQQQFIGFIARAIHDYPIITPKTTITLPGSSTPITILQNSLLLRNATIDFNIRPAPKEEAISFWSSQDTHVPRLSLFVEARVVVLDQQPAPFAPGIVLSVGNFVFPSSEPQLLTTRNEIWFQPPGKPVAKVDASPARAALFDAPGSAGLGDLAPQALVNNVVHVDAVGLAPGDRSLVLRSQFKNFTAALDLDALPSSPPSPNVNWNLEATSSSVTFSVFRDVLDDATNTAKTLLPGIYGARVIVNDPRSGDTPRPRSSNELAFAVTPQIRDAGPALSPPSPRTYVVRLIGRYLNASLDIQLSVGGRALTQVTTGTPIGGQFFVPLEAADHSDANDVDQILLVLLANDPDSGQPIAPPSASNPLPVRLVVNGATATPAWITQEAP
ncbi:MAG TPA: Pvc16 family protein [Polyangia bacterium]|jgi:hypothetical protein